jgi:ankyrin repeat protein
MTSNDKLVRMIQPRSLRTDEYQPWSRGRGEDVWAMICASITGDLSAVEVLVARDPNLVNCEYEYFKPLRFAVRENQVAIVHFLLEDGADISDEAGSSLLEIARERGHEELAGMIESKLKQLYGISPEADPVIEAIKARDGRKVKELVDSRPDLVHVADKRGNKPLHWAVMTRQLALIDYLLERGADIDAARSDGIRPLHLTNGDYHYRGWRDVPRTAIQRHEVLIGYLLARGAEYDITTAAKIGDLDRVRELLDANPVLVNQVPAYSYYIGPPLRSAAAAGHIEAVRLLLERGADPNLPEPGIAPRGGALHGAIGGKHIEVVRLLLEHGADPNAEVESSGNCLSMAKFVGAPDELVDLVASYGGKMPSYASDLATIAARLEADPNSDVGEPLDNREAMELVLRYQPDLLKRTPDPAAWWTEATLKSPEQARWLFERGLDPNRRNWLGITLLHRCAAKGDMPIAEVCLEHGADIDAIETEWLSTPLGWAAREGKKAMVEWLLARGANPDLPADEPWARPGAWAARRGHAAVLAVLSPDTQPRP